MLQKSNEVYKSFKLLILHFSSSVYSQLWPKLKTNFHTACLYYSTSQSDRYFNQQITGLYSNFPSKNLHTLPHTCLQLLQRITQHV